MLVVKKNHNVDLTYTTRTIEEYEDKVDFNEVFDLFVT